MKHITFGLTGSIACGKSTVAKFLNNLGIPSVDADLVAREVVVPGSKGLEQVIAAFGTEHLLPDGTMNRKSIGALVSYNSHELARINKIMYPLIRDESDRQLQALHDQGHELVFYDAALIIEMGNADRFRPLIVVWAELETQIDRLMKRNSIDRETAIQWISLQMSSDEKAERADFVIKTNGTLGELFGSTVDVLNKIREKI